MVRIFMDQTLIAQSNGIAQRVFFVTLILGINYKECTLECTGVS